MRLPEIPAGTVGVGWATVELDRAARDLATFLLEPGSGFADVPSSVALGARARVGRAAAGAGRAIAVVLLEPDTEGRVAATLARTGEGWAATWTVAGIVPRLRVSAVRPGPLGPERLILGGPVAGPHRLLVETATIGAMIDTTLTLRPATESDAEAIATLFTDEGYPAGPSDIVERLGHFSSDDSRVVVAEHEGAVLGFIAVHAMPRFEHDDRILRILAVVVDAGARERGVGRSLIAEAERIGAELGAAFIEITAGHHRPEARRLYESAGYDATVAAYLRKKL